MKSPTYTVPPASGSPKPKPAAPTWFSRHFNWYADEPHAISFGRGSRCIVAREIMWPVAARVQRVSKPGADQQLMAVVWLDVFSPATGKLRRELVMIDASGGLDTPAGADRLDFVFRELIGAPRFDREHREIDARSAVQHLGGDAAVEETERAAAECLANVDQGATPIVDAADDPRGYIQKRDQCSTSARRRSSATTLSLDTTREAKTVADKKAGGKMLTSVCLGQRGGGDEVYGLRTYYHHSNTSRPVHRVRDIAAPS